MKTKFEVAASKNHNNFEKWEAIMNKISKMQDRCTKAESMMVDFMKDRYKITNKIAATNS